MNIRPNSIPANPPPAPCSSPLGTEASNHCGAMTSNDAGGSVSLHFVKITLQTAYCREATARHLVVGDSTFRSHHTEVALGAEDVAVKACDPLPSA